MQQSLSYRALSQLKSFASATVNGAALLHGNQQAVWSGWRVAADDAIDKHALYQKAVQSGPGDAHHLQKFHKQYIGEGVPTHLREDFCGTALLCTAWCRQDVRRTATGIDIDIDPLQWGWKNNVQQVFGGSADTRVCLLHSNVLDDVSNAPVVGATRQQQQQQQQQQTQQQQHQQQLHKQHDTSTQAASTHNSILDQSSEHAVQLSAIRSPQAAEGIDEVASSDLGDLADSTDLRSRPADIICALNYSVCLLHKRSDVLLYFKSVRASLCKDPGGIFVMDLLGGHTVEKAVTLQRLNPETGFRFVWEQERYNPITRHLRCHITLKDPDTKVTLRHAFSYEWRMWTIPDVVELLRQAGFSSLHLWLRPTKEKSSTTQVLRADHHGANAGNKGAEDHTDDSVDEYDDVDDDDGDDEEYQEYSPATCTAAYLDKLAKGWSAYLIAVAKNK
eukprot:jgi/Chrzof1/3713/Cz13g06070.t1